MRRIRLAWVLSFLVISGSASAGAQEAEEESYSFQQMVENICALTHRCRELFPAAEVIGADEVVDTILSAYLKEYSSLTQTVPSEADVEALRKRIMEEPIPLAMYLRATDRLVTIREEVLRVRQTNKLTPGDFEAFMECVLIHEYTHALQAKHAPRSDDPQTAEMQIVLSEAHAVHVAARLCEERHPRRGLPELMDRVMGADHLRFADLDETSTALGYSAGRRWLERELSIRGEEAAWEILQEPPMTLDLLIEEDRARVPEAWHTPGALTTFIHKRVEKDEDAILLRRDGVDHAVDVLQRLTASMDPTPTDLEFWYDHEPRINSMGIPNDVASSRSLSAYKQGATYELIAFLFENEDKAGRFVARRRWELRRQGEEATAAGGPFQLRHDGGQLGRTTDESFVLIYGQDKAFLEVWARKGPVVVLWLSWNVSTRPRRASRWVSEALLSASPQ